MSLSGSQVTITGGAGFIGRHFVRRLSSMGTSVVTLDIRAPGRTEPGESVVVGDIRDPDALRLALTGSDAVLHLAAAHHDFGIDRETFFSVNEGGARSVCSAMDEAGIKRACFFSSVAVYGSSREEPAEDHPCRPDSPYGESKLAAEEVFRQWTEEEGGRALVIRPTVTFGPGNFANMYTLIRQIHSGLYLPVGPGSNQKSLVFVDNLVEATMDLWLQREGGPLFRVYNLVDKPDLSSRAIEASVFRALGRRPPRVRLPLALARLAAMPFDALIAATGRNLPISSARIDKFAVANTVFAADKLARQGIRPLVTLEAGIRKMVEWYLDQGRHLPVDRSIPPRVPTLLSQGVAVPDESVS